VLILSGWHAVLITAQLLFSPACDSICKNCSIDTLQHWLNGWPCNLVKNLRQKRRESSNSQHSMQLAMAPLSVHTLGAL
jgi:hypothetical protein